MKKQIVAILVAIAVITSLLSVSVLSQEDYKDDLWKYQQTVMNEEKRLTSEKNVSITAYTPVTITSSEDEFGGYRVSPCDAIDISFENTTVTDFLNATNMTTVQAYNFKGYKGENTWMVQWSSSDRLLDVYVNVATGNITGIEEHTYPRPSPTPSPTPTPETKTWHSVITFTGSEDKVTQPFTIKGDEWRVKWSVSSSSDWPYFYVFVYPRGETVSYVSHWSCDQPYYSDTQYIYEGNGDYYFDIGAANLNSWKLEVEDYY